jgi:hypothetical protein
MIPQGQTLPQLLMQLAQRQAGPTFKLLDISQMGDQIKRAYILEAEGLECKVVEVFTDREMLRQGAKWDAEGLAPRIQQEEPQVTLVTPTEATILSKQGDARVLLR